MSCSAMPLSLTLPEQRLLVGANEVVGLPRLAAWVAHARLSGNRAETQFGEQAVRGREQLLETGGVLLFARSA
jgi:hypothetical protein